MKDFKEKIVKISTNFIKIMQKNNEAMVFNRSWSHEKGLTEEDKMVME